MALASSGDYKNIHICEADKTHLRPKQAAGQPDVFLQDYIWYQFAKASDENRFGNLSISVSSIALCRLSKYHS